MSRDREGKLDDWYRDAEKATNRILEKLWKSTRP